MAPWYAHAMQAGDEEHEPKRADADALEHAQRAGHEAQILLGVDGVAQHSGANERAEQIDLLAAVKHGVLPRRSRTATENAGEAPASVIVQDAGTGRV